MAPLFPRAILILELGGSQRVHALAAALVVDCSLSRLSRPILLTINRFSNSWRADA